jgi:hypothetical protein
VKASPLEVCFGNRRRQGLGPNCEMKSVSLFYERTMQLRLQFHEFPQVIGATKENSFRVDF